jgi:hypothetical protein
MGRERFPPLAISGEVALPPAIPPFPADSMNMCAVPKDDVDLLFRELHTEIHHINLAFCIMEDWTPSKLFLFR